MSVKALLSAHLFLLLILISCDKDVIYENNSMINGETWNYGNTIHYDINISDTTNPHNIYINLRNTGNYPYSNIFLFVTTQAPNGVFLKDTFEITLADKQGKWLGRGTGNVFSLQAPYRINVKFPYRGIYMFDIQHAMWNKELEGIADVGLRIEKAK